VCVSDRRISAGGQPLRDDRSKAFVLSCGDARVHVAYAGLAETRSFLARDWVASSVLDVAPPNYDIQSICLRLTEALNGQFKNLAAQSDEKRFSLLISGYRYLAP